MTRVSLQYSKTFIQDVGIIASVFRNCKLIWSFSTPRISWKHSQNAKSMEQARNRVNRFFWRGTFSKLVPPPQSKLGYCLFFFNNIKGVIENFVEYSILTQVLALLKFQHVPVEYIILCYSGRSLKLPTPPRRKERVCTSVGSRLLP